MKIAVTKLKEKSEGIRELFARYGHEAFIISTMHAAEPTDPGPFSRLCEMISENGIDILIFTSALGVEKLFTKVKPGKDVRIVSVGPKTAKKVEEFGLESEVIEKFSSDNFARYMGNIRGKTIGIARAEVPNPQLIGSLISKGGIIVEAPVYRLTPEVNEIHAVLKEMEAVIFTSARSFEFSGFSRDDAIKVKVAAIGPKTADVMNKHGIKPDFVGDGTLESCLSLLQ